MCNTRKVAQIASTNILYTGTKGVNTFYTKQFSYVMVTHSQHAVELLDPKLNNSKSSCSPQVKLTGKTEYIKRLCKFSLRKTKHKKVDIVYAATYYTTAGITNVVLAGTRLPARTKELACGPVLNITLA